MKVLIDVTSLMSKELTGIGVYIKNLITNLQNRSDIRLVGTWYAEKYRFKHLISSHISIPLKPYFHIISGINILSYDVFHGPDYRIPFTRLYRKVITVHDTVDYENTIVDQKRSAENIRKLEHILLTDKPNSIIAVSHFTREQLIYRFPHLESMITVVYSGVDHIDDTISLEDRQRFIPNPYLLFVGTVEKRKNLPTAVRAFELAKSKFPDLHFVIVGTNGYKHQEIDEVIHRSRYAKHIHRIGFVLQDDLLHLYRNAELLLFPSLYEGFGFPILEAMRLGCPVVTSNRGAMKEIAGSAAILVDPLETEEMTQAILKVCEDRLQRDELIEAGKTRSQEFTWKRCAEHTIGVYRRLIHSKGIIS